MKVAAVGITHFSKGTVGRDPVERVTGSVAFGALARIVLAAAKRSDEAGGGRVFVRAKSNIGPDGDGYAYDLAVSERSGVEVATVRWGEVVSGPAREILSAAEVTNDEAVEETRDAADWLREVLTDHGATDARTMRRLADESGCAWRTVQRAAQRIGVTFSRQGFGRDCRTVWTLQVAPKDSVAPHAPHKKAGATGATARSGASDVAEGEVI
jgi:hypothetical protein